MTGILKNAADNVNENEPKLTAEQKGVCSARFYRVCQEAEYVTLILQVELESSIMINRQLVKSIKTSQSFSMPAAWVTAYLQLISNNVIFPRDQTHFHRKFGN